MTIDQGTFRELQATAGADFVRELVDAFAQDAPRLLAELRDARQAQSAERFRRAAHSLKSNGQTFGATAFAAQARALETGGLPATAQPLDDLQASYEDAVAALRALCDG